MATLCEDCGSAIEDMLFAPKCIDCYSAILCCNCDYRGTDLDEEGCCPSCVVDQKVNKVAKAMLSVHVKHLGGIEFKELDTISLRHRSTDAMGNSTYLLPDGEPLVLWVSFARIIVSFDKFYCQTAVYATKQRSTLTTQKLLRIDIDAWLSKVANLELIRLWYNSNKAIHLTILKTAELKTLCDSKARNLYERYEYLRTHEVQELSVLAPYSGNGYKVVVVCDGVIIDDCSEVIGRYEKTGTSGTLRHDTVENIAAKVAKDLGAYFIPA